MLESLSTLERECIVISEGQQDGEGGKEKQGKGERARDQDRGNISMESMFYICIYAIYVFYEEYSIAKFKKSLNDYVYSNLLFILSSCTQILYEMDLWLRVNSGI